MERKPKLIDHWPQFVFLLLAALMFHRAAYSRTIDIDEINDRVYLSCAEDDVQANDLIVFTLCNFERWLQWNLPGAKLVITRHFKSQNRCHAPNKFSQHCGDGERANAIDFFIDGHFTGDFCHDWDMYFYQSGLFEQFLKEFGLYEIVGVGLVYALNTKLGNFIFHIDFRGRPAYWAYVEDTGLAVTSGRERLQAVLKERCGDEPRT